MTRYLVLAVRFLDGRYHGLTDNGERAEWPPSPFRLFQALIAGNARGEEISLRVSKALRWLEELDPPVIVAPHSWPGQMVLTYVLNNVGARTRAPKVMRPRLISGDRLLRYYWAFDDAEPDAASHSATVVDAMRHIRALGWGIDLAIGFGETVDRLPGGGVGRTEYKPIAVGGVGGIESRVPRRGSLQSLSNCYRDLLKRNKSPGATDLETADVIYDQRGYTVGNARPSVVFALRTSGDDYWSYPHAKLIHIAGMTRCAAIKAMNAYHPAEVEDKAAWVESFVAGHRPEGAENHQQFSYIPLPSIGHEHSDAMIRRVMIAAPFGHEAQLRHLANQLDGEQLKPEGGGEGPVLYRLRSDSVTRQYLDPSRVWASVTPVILPGHDDHKPEKAVKLIERAFRQSGIDQPCQYTWGAMPNFAHCLTAHKYDQHGHPTGYYRPDHLAALTAVHIRVTFEHPVAGPLSIGAGRHCGLGVLAGLNSGDSRLKSQRPTV